MSKVGSDDEHPTQQRRGAVHALIISVDDVGTQWNENGPDRVYRRFVRKRGVAQRHTHTHTHTRTHTHNDTHTHARMHAHTPTSQMQNAATASE